MKKNRRDSEDDRRSHARLSTEVNVDGRILSPHQVGELLKGLEIPNMVTVSSKEGKSVRMASVNMSQGGLCLTGALAEMGKEAMEIGSNLFIEIEIPDGHEALKAVAKVAWVRDFNSQVGRLGLEYVKLDADGLKRIRAYFEKRQ